MDLERRYRRPWRSSNCDCDEVYCDAGVSSGLGMELKISCWKAAPALCSSTTGGGDPGRTRNLNASNESGGSLLDAVRPKL